MNGIVDESLRALIAVPVASANDASQESLTVWIDTAFNGGLVIPHRHIEGLGLKKASTTQAVLADGNTVDRICPFCEEAWTDCKRACRRLEADWS